jgi:hypothetical protein
MTYPGCYECSGKASGCIAGCIVPQCVKQHGVEYCGYCPELPCDNNNVTFSPNVLRKWLEGNEFIRENGIESYFEKNKMLSYYIEFYVN